MRRIAGAAAALGTGAAFSGNIDPGHRRYGTPGSLGLRRARQENLMRLALAREEVPTGVWEEASALARLATEVARSPDRARAFGRDPAGALRALGYEAAGLRLDEPEIRTCLLLAEEEVQEAIASADPEAFIRALRARGIGPSAGDSRLAEAFRQALREDEALGLRPPPEGGELSQAQAAPAATVVVAVVLVAVAVVAVVVVAVYAAIVAWTAVSVSGGGGLSPRRGDPDSASLAGLAQQSGNPELARRVRDALLVETAASLAPAVVEAAAMRGVELEYQEAERQVRSALERILR